MVHYAVPTVLHVGGLRIAISPNDHLPAHVHCFVGDGTVVVLLEPAPAARERVGVKAPEVARVLAAVRRHRGFLTQEWRRIRG